MRKRLGFLFLVTFFTLFGAGRGHFWTRVTTDQSGWTYAVDLYSIKVQAPEVIRCRVLATHDSGSQVKDTWLLDAGQSRLTRSSVNVPEAILPNSVAQQTILFFRQRGDLSVVPSLAGGSRR